MTFPRATGQVPTYLAHTNSGRPPDVNDKYTTGYNDLTTVPLFPFGYGLSYTSFRYTDLRLARYFGRSEGFFLGLQMDYDLMQRRREIDRDLKAIRPRAA